jgi:hypothetical protein
MRMRSAKIDRLRCGFAEGGGNTMSVSTEPSSMPRPGEQCFTWADGEMRLWTATPRVLLVTMMGMGSASVMPAFTAAAPRPPADGRHWLFFDVYLLENYESALRVQMTRWVDARRATLAELHVLHHSKLVAMGVAVANLALGGIINSHTRRATFQSEFDRVLALPGTR